MGFYTDLVAAIKSTIETVTDVGVVETFDRYANTEVMLREMYEFTPAGETVPEIRGWFMTRVKVDTEWNAFGECMVTEHHFKLFGVYGHDDSRATEITFQELVDEVIAAIAAERDFGGLVDNWIPRKPVVAKEIDLKYFAGMAVHFAELEFILGVEQTNPQT